MFFSKNQICFVLIWPGLFFLLFGCSPRRDDISCEDAVPVSERNGHKVRKTLNGLFLKHEFGMSDCANATDKKELQKSKLVTSVFSEFYWKNGALISYQDVRASELKKYLDAPFIKIRIKFPLKKTSTHHPKWWHEPSIPHEIYPINLLPNYGLEQPDPRAGNGPVLSKPTIYWAVRNTRTHESGLSEITFCSLRPPSSWDGKDHSDAATHARDPVWLVKAPTYKVTIGNTCRGSISSGDGKISGTIDVPGAALLDIDKIYQAASAKLTEYIVD